MKDIQNIMTVYMLLNAMHARESGGGYGITINCIIIMQNLIYCTINITGTYIQ